MPVYPEIGGKHQMKPHHHSYKLDNDLRSNLGISEGLANPNMLMFVWQSDLLHGHSYDVFEAETVIGEVPYLTCMRI